MMLMMLMLMLMLVLLMLMLPSQTSLSTTTTTTTTTMPEGSCTLRFHFRQHMPLLLLLLCLALQDRAATAPGELLSAPRRLWPANAAKRAAGWLGASCCTRDRAWACYGGRRRSCVAGPSPFSSSSSPYVCMGLCACVFLAGNEAGGGMKTLLCHIFAQLLMSFSCFDFAVFSFIRVYSSCMSKTTEMGTAPPIYDTFHTAQTTTTTTSTQTKAFYS